MSSTGKDAGEDVGEATPHDDAPRLERQHSHLRLGPDRLKRSQKVS